MKTYNRDEDQMDRCQELEIAGGEAEWNATINRKLEGVPLWWRVLYLDCGDLVHKFNRCDKTTLNSTCINKHSNEYM